MKVQKKIMLVIIATLAIILISSNYVQATSSISATVEASDDNAIYVLNTDNAIIMERVADVPVAYKQYEAVAEKDVYADLVIDDGYNLALYLVGYSLYNYSSDSAAITVEEGASLGITDGNILSNSNTSDGEASTGAVIYNYGDLTIYGDINIYGANSTSPVIYNYGTLTINEGANIYYSGEEAIVNEGTLENNGNLIYVEITTTEEKTEEVTDNETNVKLEFDTSVLSKDVELTVDNVTSGTMYDTATKALKDIVSTMKIYEITLELDGEATEPDGYVKIYIPIADGMDKENLVAYRIDEDGTKTEYKVTVDGDYAVIETNHFSTYVLAELASTTTTTTTTENDTKTTTTTEASTTTTETTTTETSTTKTTTDTTDTTTEELDETPKTGASEISAQISMLVALISIASLALIKRNH